jgi:integral membrane sensor domain MASE1
LLWPLIGALVCFGAVATTIVLGPDHSWIPAALYFVAAAMLFWERRAWKRKRRKRELQSAARLSNG